MYERSAIVLERYFDKIFGENKENNLKTNYGNYTRIIEELKEYQRIIEEEEKVIRKFDEIAVEMEKIQKEQSEIHESNLEMENERNRLFNDLGENPNTLDNKLKKIMGPLDYQAVMLDKYIENYDEKTLALELPTGSGKTLVGLLIGEYRRRKNKEKSS